MADFSLLAGAAAVFVPALLLTMLVGRNFNSFLGWLSVFMFAAAVFEAIPSWFMYAGIMLGGVFLYMKVFR